MIIKSESCHYVDNKILITIYITHRCNFSCHYCYDTKNRKNKDITLDELRLFFMNYKLTYNKKCQIHLIGGEPTLHKDFIKFCQLCSEQSFVDEVWVTTNGSLEKETWLEIKNILNEKLLIITSYHPSNRLGLQYYIDLFDFFKQNNFRVNIPFMLDINSDFEELINQYNTLNQFGYEVRTNTLEPFNKYPYDNKYLEWIKSTYFETNRFLKITFSDTSEKQVPLSEVYKTEPNMFLGMKCLSLENKWVIDSNMMINSSCDLNPSNAYNCLNIFDFKRFIKSLKSKRCTKNRCDNTWAHYYKEL